MEFFKKQTHIRFMATRRWWYAVSAVLIVGSLALVGIRGLNLGVDFTGGVTIEAAFPQAADLDAVRTALAQAGFAEAQVQNFGTSQDVMIRLPPIDADDLAELRLNVAQALATVDPAAEVRGGELVGPQVGAELRESAIWAFCFTVLMIFIYVLFRFHTWRLSVSGIVAALHDPILLLGFFALTQLPFDLSVVAAILAVVGYSLNDTVVIFDRIRERFELSRRQPPPQVIDDSINQTLSRTIMTAVTTLIVVGVLYAIGGPVLQPFSITLILGVLVGTYSSIYIAGALALDLGLRAEHLFPLAKKHPVDHLP